MIPMRPSTVFKNRWMALLWAAGIVWLALDVAGTGDQATNASSAGQLTDASGTPVSNQDVQNVANILN